MTIRERYQPYLVSVDGTQVLTGVNVGGFLCKTSGTISLVQADSTVIVDEVPVTAGGYYPIPALLKTGGAAAGASFTCAGGASGTLFA